MNILVFPKATNPYQELLYREMNTFSNIHYQYITFHITKYFLANVFLFPCLLLYKRFQKYTLIHIHWWYEIHADTKNGLGKQLFSTLYIVWMLMVIKLLGYKLIYTMHDNIAKDSQFLFGKIVTSILLSLSNHVIVLSPSTIRELTSMHIPILKNKFSIIPHGDYSTWYENSVSFQEARKLLHIQDNSFVLLFFGIIQKYKGLTNLFSDIETLSRSHKNIVLIIAGACYDMTIQNKILAFSKKFPSLLRLSLHHIEDEDVQTYLNACDIAVFPFERITNSGSAVLAASFKKPFIAPSLGSIQDFPQNTGVFYDAYDKKGLHDAIEAAIRKKRALSRYGANGYRYVHRISWRAITKNTIQVYMHCLHQQYQE